MTAKKPSTSSDFPPEVLSLFDQYVHNIIDRRGFLDGAGKLALDGRSPSELLEALSPRFAEAQQVAAADPGIRGSYVEFVSPNGHGRGRGYLVHPAGAGRRRRSRRSLWCTRTGGSIRTSRTWRDGWPSRTSSRSRRTHFSHSVDIQGTKTRRAGYFRNWTRRRPARTSSQPQVSRGPCPKAAADLVSWASATAVASRVFSPLGCWTSRLRFRFTAALRLRTRSPTSGHNSLSTLANMTNGSMRPGRPTRRR